MTARVARLLARSLFGLFIASILATAVVVLGSAGDPFEILVVIAIGYAIVGALVASREPANAVGWLLLATAVILGVDTLTGVYVVAPERPGHALAGWLNSWALHLWLTLPALFLPLVFPTGRLLSRRWRKVGWLGAIAVALQIVGTAFVPGVLDDGSNRPIRNPLGVDGLAGDVLSRADEVGSVLVAATLVLAGLSLVQRLRRSRGREHQQVKWFVYVGVLTLIPLVVLAIVNLFAGNPFPPWLDILSTIAWWSLVALILVGVPMTIGIAILRHRLYDIDVVINRTLVYGALTITLGVTYLGGVLLLQLVLSPVTQGRARLSPPRRSSSPLSSDPPEPAFSRLSTGGSIAESTTREPPLRGSAADSATSSTSKPSAAISRPSYATPCNRLTSRCGCVIRERQDEPAYDNPAGVDAGRARALARAVRTRGVRGHRVR